MGILSGNPKDEPMHYGEVFGVWAYLATAQGLAAGYQVFLNHIGDKDLHKLVSEALELKKQELQQIETLLKENGVSLPPAPPDRPKASAEEIPVGARFMDGEISLAVSKDIAAGLIACSTIMGHSIREDIGAMFGQFHVQKAALGLKFLRLNKEKGWLIPPPLHQAKIESE